MVAGVVGFVHWKHEDDFRPLYTSMAPEDAAGVVQKLRETGVEYRLSDNGGTVMVPSSKLGESRLALAAAGLPKTGRIGFELFDKSNFGATEFVEHINYQRALEGELERSVMSLAEVEQARVHLTLPKESVFLDQQQPAKASVMVKLRPGAQISPQNVLAVTNLVASAVEGLTPDGVSLVDMDGNLLSRPASRRRERWLGDHQRIARSAPADRTQPGGQDRRNAGTAARGQGFRAGASVDCDLTSGEQQEETLDPAHSVMLSSQKTEDVTERATTSGIPGTASNLPQQASSSAKGTGGISRRTENVTYQTSRIVRHTKIPQGVIRRMSLAVLVDQTRAVGRAGKRAAPRAGAARAGNLEDHSRPGSRRNGVQCGARRPAHRRDAALRNQSPRRTAATIKPVAAPASKSPAWLEFATKYRDLWAPVSLGLARAAGPGARRLPVRAARSRKGIREVRLPAELEGPAARTELSPAAAEIAAAAIRRAAGPHRRR